MISTATRFALSMALLVSLPCFVSTAFSATIQVPADQPSIQAAIDSAKNGDTVLVSPGTYVENIDFHGKGIIVKSSGGPRVTTIDAHGAAPAASFLSGEKVTSELQGFTLENGVGNQPPMFADGGGVAISNSSPSIIGNVITNNSGPISGGGIGLHFSSPVISNNVISHNTAEIGGGISIGGASTPQILGNKIIGNTATEWAGGIELNGAGAAMLQNNIIQGNNGGTQGGGLHFVNEADALVIQNLVANNIAAVGGGVYISVPFSATGLLFVNNTIANNKGMSGSGVYASGFDHNDTFLNNLVIGRPGEVALNCDSSYDPNPPVFQANDAFSTSGVGFQGSCASDVGTNGNISSDPLFVNPKAGNFQLMGSSPAVDAGVNFAPSLPQRDLLNHRRILDGNGDGNAVVDMGAYEFQ